MCERVRMCDGVGFVTTTNCRILPYTPVCGGCIISRNIA